MIVQGLNSCMISSTYQIPSQIIAKISGKLSLLFAAPYLKFENKMACDMGHKLH